MPGVDEAIFRSDWGIRWCVGIVVALVVSGCAWGSGPAERDGVSDEHPMPAVVEDGDVDEGPGGPAGEGTESPPWMPGPLAPTGEEDWDEAVTFYPTYGYRLDDDWVIPLRLRVHDERGWLEFVVSRITRSVASLTRDEADRFRVRIAEFLADNESREHVTFAFEGDPLGEDFQILGTEGEPIRSDLNGIISGYVRVPVERAEGIVRAQASDDGWLTIWATSDDHHGRGRVRLIEREGLSVISDIDDTMQVVGIPEGAMSMVWNIFFEPWEAAPGMAELYRKWEEEADGTVAFHYVSAGPWQLYRYRAGFLFDEAVGFSEGTFHMREIRKNFFSPTTWRDLHFLLADDDSTYERKVEMITRILEHFPGREFILVGDTGEHDPEVYRTIAEGFPHQVREVVIRDVVDARTLAPERVEGMTVIPAETMGVVGLHSGG